MVDYLEHEAGLARPGEGGGGDGEPPPAAPFAPALGVPISRGLGFQLWSISIGEAGARQGDRTRSRRALD